VYGGYKEKTMKQKKQQLTWAVLTMLLAQSVQAAEQLPGLVVTADRIAQDQASISADVTVISQQEIEQSQASSVADLLRNYGGLDVAASGGPGKVTSVFMRGANSGHTLVLIDGVRVGAATTGIFDWGALSTAGIERIEIVRGAQSSLYGADAMGGVIQLFTRKGQQGGKADVNVEVGSLASSKAAMAVSGMSATGVSYALNVEGTRTQGVSAASAGTEKDGFRNTTLSGNIVMPIGLGQLELTLRNSDANTALDGFGPVDALNYTSQNKQMSGSARLSYPLGERVESTLQLSRSIDESVTRDPAVAFNNADFSSRIDQLTWQNYVDLEPASLLFGIDMHQDRGASGGSAFNKSVSQSAGFVSLGWSTAIADINASLRYDRNSVSQNKTTYKLGGVLRPVEGLKFSANYGTGFKAPSINDLYFPGAGNANLKPETSKGWDAGVAYDWQQDGLQTGLIATWFKQDFNNLIAWAPVTPGSFIWLPSNVNQARTEGVELAAYLTAGITALHANWTFLNAKDVATGTFLAQRAKASGNVTLSVDQSGMFAEVAMHIVGARFSGTGNTQPMAAYRTIALRGSYQLNDLWSFNARIENAGNKKYEEVKGYGVLGRVWYTDVSASF